MSEIPLNRSIRLTSTDTNKSELLDFPSYSAMVTSNANQWLHFVGTNQFVGPQQQGAIVTLAGTLTAEVEWAAPPGAVQPPATPATEADIVFYSVWMPPTPGTSGSVQQSPKPYDGQANHAPGAGVQATVTLAGVAGRRWVCAMVVATYVNAGAAAASQLGFHVLDGAATELLLTTLCFTATSGDKDRLALTGLAYFGSAGAPMTVEFTSAGPANSLQRVSFGTYLV